MTHTQKFILLGDFNTDIINKSTPKEIKLKSTLDLMALTHQQPKMYTYFQPVPGHLSRRRNKTIIDYIFIDDYTSCSHAEVMEAPAVARDHRMVLLEIQNDSSISNSKWKSTHNMKVRAPKLYLKKDYPSWIHWLELVSGLQPWPLQLNHPSPECNKPLLNLQKKMNLAAQHVFDGKTKKQKAHPLELARLKQLNLDSINCDKLLASLTWLQTGEKLSEIRNMKAHQLVESANVHPMSRLNGPISITDDDLRDQEDKTYSEKSSNWGICSSLDFQ